MRALVAGKGLALADSRRLGGPFRSGPLLRGEPYVRTAGGANVEVFRLALSPGTRVSIPLGTYGELAVANDEGLLALTVPVSASLWLARRRPP